MKVAIIGCGWLGLPLAKKLKLEGCEVLGSTQKLEKLELLEEEKILPLLYKNGDTLDKQILGDLDLLIITIPPNKSDEYKSVISKLINQFPQDLHVIFTSTIGVYKDSVLPISEESETLEYHKVLDAENLIQSYFNNSIILRLAGLIGEDRHPIKFLAGKELKNSNQAVNLIHRGDIIHAVWSLAQNRVKAGIFNLCFPDHPTKENYYSEIADNFMLPRPNFIPSTEIGKNIDGSMIERKLGFKYSFPII